MHVVFTVCKRRKPRLLPWNDALCVHTTQYPGGKDHVDWSLFDNVPDVQRHFLADYAKRCSTGILNTRPTILRDKALQILFTVQLVSA